MRLKISDQIYDLRNVGYKGLIDIATDLGKGIDIEDLPEKFDREEVISCLRDLLIEKNVLFEKVLDKEEKVQKLGKIKRKIHTKLHTKTYKTLKNHQNNVKKIEEESQQSQLTANIVLSVIKIIKNNPVTHIDREILDSAAQKLFDEGVIASKEDFVDKLTPYLSSVDVMVKNDNKTEVRVKIQEIAGETYADRPSYAYKTGLENKRELLAQKMLAIAGLDRYVLPKIEQRMEKGVLGKEANPTGIASRWIEGNGYDNTHKKTFLEAKKAYNLAKVKGKRAAKEKRAFDRARKKLLEDGGLESIVDNVIIDMVFGANDSHSAQYKQGPDGEFYNFDWAQFMHPHFAYRHNGQTISTLRSAMLDHPIVDQSMNDDQIMGFDVLQAAKEKIESWDVDKMISAWEEAELIGSPTFFDEKQRFMEELIQDKHFCQRSNSHEEAVLKIAEKYGIEVDPKMSEDELKPTVSKQLVNLYWEVKAECLEKIHPKAVEQLRSRMTNMQEYIRNAENPTLKGAWNAYYPELKIFQEVAGRLIANPGENMAVQRLRPTEIEQQNKKIQELIDSLSNKKSINLRPELKEKILSALKKMPQRYGAAKDDTRPMGNNYNAEFLDPKHRYGGDIFPFYQVWSSNLDIIDSFNVWMSKLDSGEKVPGVDQLRKKNLLKDDGTPIEMRTVSYLNAKQRKECQLKMNEDGKWYTDKRGILSSENETTHIFVKGTDGNFYVEEYHQGTFNHSSFFSGEPVKGAGRMEFKDGFLLALKDHSGHYHPTDEMTRDTLQALKGMLGDEKFQFLRVQFVMRDDMNAQAALQFLEKKASTLEELPKIVRRSLEAIIVQAQDEGVASKKEINKMKEALKTIQGQCASIQEERTVNAKL